MSLKSDIERVKAVLSEASNVVIVSHHNPDGDAVGSMLGFHHALKTMGIDAQMVLPNAFPKFLSWLPGSKSIVNQFYKKQKAQKIIANADVIFALDFNGYGRLEDMAPMVKSSRASKVIIDHHPDPDTSFDIILSNLNVSSTAELVFEVAMELAGSEAITFESATCLFTGIMTDTGSFSYACSNPRTFQIAAELVAKGVDVEHAQGMVYNNFSESRMRLMGYSISNKMKVFPEHRAAYITLTRKELNDFNYSIGDTEGLVNYPLSINGIVMSALLVENGDFIKVSLRSRGTFPVNEVCGEYFQGGGHRNAAGGKSFTSMEQTHTIFEEMLSKYHDKLNEAS